MKTLKTIKSWTDEEKEILKKYYPTEGTTISIRLPKRTKEAIKRYARKNKIKYIGPKRHIKIKIGL